MHSCSSLHRSFAALAAFALLQTGNLRAQHPDQFSAGHGSALFIENRGQIVDDRGQTRPDILYRAELGGVELYLSRERVSYVFTSFDGDVNTFVRDLETRGADSAAPLQAHIYRMDAELIGANPEAQVVPEEQAREYDNYYLPHCPDGITHVRTFRKLVYREIYPKIDMLLIGTERGVTCDFVVRPGGRASDIRFRYGAVGRLAVTDSGTLLATTPLGFVEEAAPFAYHMLPDGGHGGTIHAAYHVDGDQVRFDVAPYDSTRTLVIDPTRQWATYYGANRPENLNGGDPSEVDRDGNVLITGYTTSSSFPTTPGAQQTTYGGAGTSGHGDAFVVKMNGQGNRLWATYYGGSLDEIAHGIASDFNRNVFIAGHTESANFPVSNAYQSTRGGNASNPRDAFVVKFDSAGVRQWATYYGGSSFDDGYGFATDSSGNVAVLITTRSSGLATSGTFQSSKPGGTTNDALLVKFSASGSRMWATYYGGSSDEYGYAVAADTNDNIFMTGWTQSTDFPVTTGAFQTSLGGSSDAFLVKFNSSGTRQWATYFGGSGRENLTTGGSTYCGVATDGSGNVCICGLTTGNLPISTSAVQSTYGGGGSDGFVAKFSPGGARAWSTYCGGSGEDVAAGVASNTIGGVLVTGYTYSGNFPVTTTSSQWNYGGSGDAFMLKLSSAGALQWSTYYGGSGSDEGEGISFDLFGSVMVAGFTGSTNFPVTSGAYQGSNAGSNDAFMVLFCDMERPLIDSTGLLTICEGDSVTVLVPAGYARYVWYLDNSPSAVDTTNQLVVRRAGTYSVKVWNAGGCYDYSDTVQVNYYPKPVAQITGPRVLCTGDTATLDAGPGFARYLWSTGETTQSIRAWQPGSYGLRVFNIEGCSDTTTIDMTLHPRPSVDISPKVPQTICEGDSLLLTATAGPDVTGLVWSDGQVGASVWVKNGGSYFVRALNQFGCIATSDSVRVGLHARPALKLVPSGRLTLCSGDSVVLRATPGLGRYRWSTGDSATALTVKAPGLYVIRVTDTAGCFAEASVQVEYVSRPQPVLQRIGATNLCEGDSIILDAGPGFASYVWSDGEVGNRRVIRQTGRYFVTASSATGCVGNSDTVTVTVWPHPNASIAGPKLVCANYQGHYEAAFVPDARYTWSVDGSAGSILAGGTGTDSMRIQWGPSGKGIVTLTVQDTVSGCTSTTQLPVDIGSALVPNITASRSPRICDGDSIRLDAGSGYARYQWSTGETTRAIVIRTPGVYAVDVVDAGGCQGTSVPFEVKSNPAPQPSIVASATAICPGDSATLDAGAFASYTWSTGARTRSIRVTKSGAYSVMVVDSNGCSGAAAPVTIVVRDPLRPEITGPASVCIDARSVYSVVDSTRGDSYAWRVSNGGIITSGQGTGTITVQWGSKGGAEQIDVREQSAATLCVGDATTFGVSVGTGLLPTISVRGNARICRGDSVTLVAPPGYESYLWSNGAKTSSIRVGAGGSYSVHVTDATGCSGDAPAIAVEVVPLPTPVITPPAPMICKGESVTLSAGAGYASYLWSNGAKTATIDVDEPGLYTVTVADALGCDGTSAAATVTVLPAPDVPKITMSRDTLISTPADAYQWSKDGAPITGATGRRLVVTADSGLYAVTVTNAAGCSATSPAERIYGGAAATVSLPDVEAAPGEHVAIPLHLDDSRNLRADNADGFRFRLRYDRTLLRPVTPVAASADVGSDRLLTFLGKRPPGMDVGTLAELEFVATLGDAVSTPLTIESFLWSDTSVAVVTYNGVFRLKGLCTDGGTRLIKVSGATELKSSRPNPAGGIAEIEYETVETGPTQLYVVDLLGRRIATIVSGTVSAGRYVATLDVSRIPTGLYFCVLETPTQRLNRPLQIAR